MENAQHTSDLRAESARRALGVVGGTLVGSVGRKVHAAVHVVVEGVRAAGRQGDSVGVVGAILRNQMDSRDWIPLQVGDLREPTEGHGRARSHLEAFKGLHATGGRSALNRHSEGEWMSGSDLQRDVSLARVVWRTGAIIRLERLLKSE